jgi:hypothetical protein
MTGKERRHAPTPIRRYVSPLETDADAAGRTGAAIPTAGASEDHRIALFPVVRVGTCVEQQRCGQEQNGDERNCVGESASWRIAVRERKMARRHSFASVDPLPPYPPTAWYFFSPCCHNVFAPNAIIRTQQD